MFKSNSEYTKIINLILVWTIAMSLIQSAVIAAFGLQGSGDAAPVGALLVLGLAFLNIPIYIYVIGRNWPTIEGGWSWSRLWAGAFGISRLGYERPGLKNLPWSNIITLSVIYGFAGTLNQYLVDADAGTPEIPLVYGIMVIMISALMPAVFAIMYGIGYLFGENRQRRLQTV